MSQRWWSPKGPAIGPDDQDRVLLTSLGDPKQDLVSSLLAHHRIGAAACLVAAQSPLVDEHALIEYLALARQSYAPPLVESVSKSLGEQRHAGLLVRDVADAAEVAVVDLFRAAVAKGVAPPLAAQRCAMVYGVPTEGMGSFRSLALIPQSSPVALTDAADRALFESVEKYAREELADSDRPWEPISKAPGRVVVRDKPDTTFYDGRDAKGKFAPDEVEEEEDEDDDEYVGPQVGRRQSSRSRLTARQASVNARVSPRAKAAQAKTASLQPTGARLQSPIVSSARVSTPLRMKPIADKLTSAQVAELLAPLQADPVAGLTTEEHNNLFPVATGEVFTETDRTIGFALSTEQNAEIMHNAIMKSFSIRPTNTSDDGGYVKKFRFGHVANDLDIEFADVEGDEENRHENWVTFWGERAWAYLERDLGRSKPVDVYISDKQLENIEPKDHKAYVNEIKEAAVVTFLDSKGVTPFSEGRAKWDSLVKEGLKRMKPSRDASNEGNVYVWSPSGTGVGYVVEYFIKGGAKIQVDGTKRHQQIKMDPNQAWVVLSYDPDIGPTDDDHGLVYDHQNHVWRVRYYLVPDFDDIHKALRTFREQDVVRDESGRFAEEPDDVLEEDDDEEETFSRRSQPARQQGRRVVSDRSRKAIAQAKLVPTGVQRANLTHVGSAGATATPAIIRYAERVAAKLTQIPLTTTNPKTPKHELLKSRSYTVMSVAAYEQLAEDHLDENDVARYGPNRRAFIEDSIDGQSAAFKMKEMVHDQILKDDMKHGGVAHSPLRVATGSPLVMGHMDEEADARAIQAYVGLLLEKYPDVQHMEVFLNSDNSLNFLGNKYRADNIVLVEEDPELDYTKPIKVVSMGTRGYEEFVTDFNDDFNYSAVINPDAKRNPNRLEPKFSGAMHRIPTNIVRPIIDHYRLVNE